MKSVLTFLFILLSFTVQSQNDALFKDATDAYNAGNYNKAIENYLEIVKAGQHSPELYFNLGNSYYKLNQVAPSIYYFEKALLLKPNDPEIKNNLAYAQNMTLDAIELMPETGLSKIYQEITGFLSFDQWGYVAIVFMILFVLLYIGFYYLKYATQKRIAFITSIVSLLLAVVSVVLAFLQYADFQTDQPAIVFDSEAKVTSEPNKRSQVVFTLHEGTKLNVLEELDGYKKIRIADGQTGWLSSESIKLLKDF
ncbi:tetratricopeptide repeat protein [Maribacter algarum]|uniref:Tetratricopeptide repeat protein n=1 Tax=Maribacter algarum (ex Zhang et al. 2020) TaxID=2578118 RepID=A0A5S3PW71_9FLAO|nr:tetratricopeptide repeat protein [Maribacter algarum]TMM59170.1 tetratricopeptide repeat protein [Maribacter algarum]